MKIDDLVEIVNHFEACCYMLETLMEPITTAYIRKLHRMLFYGTVADKSKELHIGEFRKRPDKLGVAQEKIADMLGALIKEYEANKKVKVDDILHFHCIFEKIHPFPTLSNKKLIQLYKIPISHHATGFRKESSILQNAQVHTFQECIINIDLKDFFPTITIDDVFRIFNYYGYTKEVSYTLAKLCTCDGIVPQGSPASPCISNIACLKLDKHKTHQAIHNSNRRNKVSSWWPEWAPDYPEYDD